MKLASKEAIGLMLDGEVLVNDEGGRVWYSYTEGFRYQYMDTQPEPIDGAWTTGGWELQKKYKPLPEKWTNDWANWRAIDSNGALFEYEFKPYQEFCIWFRDGGNRQRISEGHDPTNWENSLEERTPTTGEQSILKRIERIEQALGINKL